MDIKPQFLDYIQNLKKTRDLKIIDSHIHPFDVMGIIHNSSQEKTKNNKDNTGVFKPGIMEKMRFSALANFLSRASFKFLPKIVIDEVKSAYNNPQEKRILIEMEQALVDEIVLLPIEPWAKTEEVKNIFNNKRFFLLGSIDINRISTGEIENTIKKYIDDFKIIGLKLHPNLQNFKPQPSQNDSGICEKLEIIYKTAEKFRLYLLFHGGLSDFTEYIDPSYGDIRRSKTNALLENFCNSDGSSEIFEQYNIPIIIAHLGHFGKNRLNSSLLKTISEKYPSVYFDTAAVSPAMIREAIEMLSSRRILLGSDGLYNRMIYSIYFVYLAALKAKTNENMDDIMANILGNNFYSMFF